MLRRFHSLRHDERGVTIIEFTLIAPVLLVTIMGIFDFALNYYVKSVLEGAVQQAARNSTIESSASSPGANDAAVRATVGKILSDAEYSFTRAAYTSYADVGQPEEFVDTNSDGICNNREQFVDTNGNGRWDRDRSLEDTAGARDAVVYTVEVTYERFFPLASLLGFDDQIYVRAQTVLRNQPFSQQMQTSEIGDCR